MTPSGERRSWEADPVNSSSARLVARSCALAACSCAVRCATPSFELLIDESELALGRFLLADVAHHDERHRTLGDLNRRHVNFGFERLVGIGPFEGPLKDRCALALQRLVVLEDRLSAAHTVRLNVCRYLVETLTDERLLLGNAEGLSRLRIPLDDPPVLQQQDASERAFE
jgi:hypothetical protein